MKKLSRDVLIVGGGIAGLWLQQRLHRAGYHTLLVEAEGLGGKQSSHSQGIIHGGTKYTLQGMLTPASQAIAGMPDRWLRALDTGAEVPLQSARRLSDAHFMWSTEAVSSKLSGFLASRALRGRVEPVGAAERPPIFQHEQFRGHLYRLHEFVLEVPTVVEALRLPGLQVQARAGDSLCYRAGGWEFPAHDLRVEARRTVLTAGEGTEALVAQLGLEVPMQRRPLQMVMVKHRTPLALFAHCVGASSTPLLTVTTHPHPDGSTVWYLGGQLSEVGVERSEAEQLREAQGLVRALLPWVKLESPSWATLRIQRAEPLQAGLVRPDGVFVKALDPFLVCWPTKLALAPALSDEVLRLLPPPSGRPGEVAELEPLLSELTPPPVARPVWERL